MQTQIICLFRNKNTAVGKSVRRYPNETSIRRDESCRQEATAAVHAALPPGHRDQEAAFLQEVPLREALRPGARLREVLPLADRRPTALHPTAVWLLGRLPPDRHRTVHHPTAVRLRERLLPGRHRTAHHPTAVRLPDRPTADRQITDRPEHSRPGAPADRGSRSRSTTERRPLLSSITG